MVNVDLPMDLAQKIQMGWAAWSIHIYAFFNGTAPYQGCPPFSFDSTILKQTCLIHNKCAAHNKIQQPVLMHTQ